MRKILLYLFLAATATPIFAQNKIHRPSPPRVPPLTSAPQKSTYIATFQQLLDAGVAYARGRNVENNKIWHLSSFQNGGFRNESEHFLVKTDSANAEIKIKYIELGFYFPDKKEWSWIWWNNPASEPLKEYGRAHKIKELMTEFLTLDNTVDAIKLAQAAAYVLNAKGIEAIPSPDGSHFWLVAYESIGDN